MDTADEPKHRRDYRPMKDESVSYIASRAACDIDDLINDRFEGDTESLRALLSVVESSVKKNPRQDNRANFFNLHQALILKESISEAMLWDIRTADDLIAESGKLAAMLNKLIEAPTSDNGDLEILRNFCVVLSRESLQFRRSMNGKLSA